MTVRNQKITAAGILAAAVILTAVLALSGFETKSAHNQSIGDTARVIRAEMDVRAVRRDQQNTRILCELQAIRNRDLEKVCP